MSILQGYFGPHQFDLEKSSTLIAFRKLDQSFRELYKTLPERSSLFADLGVSHADTLKIKTKVGNQTALALELAKQKRELM